MPGAGTIFEHHLTPDFFFVVGLMGVRRRAVLLLGLIANVAGEASNPGTRPALTTCCFLRFCPPHHHAHVKKMFILKQCR
jgi:hypothetical protein